MAEILKLTNEIVSAYVSHNAVPVTDLAGLLRDVHTAMVRAVSGSSLEARPAIIPAVPVNKSIQKDFLICLECGRKFKSIRRHIGTEHGLSREEYIAKFSLPGTYPFVAPGYSAHRSKLAKENGLGQIRVAPKVVVVDKVKEPAKKRGRPKKNAA